MEAELDKHQMEADLQLLVAQAPDRRFATLLNWVLGNNPQRRAVATYVMQRMGEATTKLLLGKALGPRLGSRRRIQLLAVIEQLELPLDIGQWFDLFSAFKRFD